MKGALDLVTADFSYVRWLGNRKVIEEQTTTWDKTVIDRASDLKNWVDLLKAMVNDKRIRKLFAFANNHYTGHGPATVKLFRRIVEREEVEFAYCISNSSTNYIAFDNISI